MQCFLPSFFVNISQEVEEPGTWTPSKPFDQGLDPAKDPCLKIKCSRHKVCVAEDYKTATCVSQSKPSGLTSGS
ncbi:testican-3-like isoform X1 [Lates japonicus]|uniref:Testican-3-like isoform X1 n=1 Tax=Lates japonicus TaxID=270547 RepID=A0AAD3N7J1_LATJO|nr:testican-3-like isoform X1 [Lates japonicus]